MCTRRGARSLLLSLLQALEDEEPDDTESPKAARTLLEEYPPGTRKVLPEHRPYGPLAPAGEQ